MRSCRSSFVIINMCTRFLLAWSNWSLYPATWSLKRNFFLSISIYWKVVLWDGESGGSPPALGISARGWARWWASPTRSSSVCSATRSSRPRRSRRPTWPPGTGSHSRGPSTKACAASTPEWGGEEWKMFLPSSHATLECNHFISWTRILILLSEKNSSGCVFQCSSRWINYFLNKCIIYARSLKFLQKLIFKVIVWDLRWRKWRYRHKRRKRCYEDTTLPGSAASATRSGQPRGSLSSISAKLITLAAKHSYSINTPTTSHLSSVM